MLIEIDDTLFTYSITEIPEMTYVVEGIWGPNLWNATFWGLTNVPVLPC